MDYFIVPSGDVGNRFTKSRNPCPTDSQDMDSLVVSADSFEYPILQREGWNDYAILRTLSC